MSILTEPPSTDPTPVLRYRDGLYAVDLLAAAVSHLDFFSWLGAHPGATTTEIREHFQFMERPADVLLTLCRANGFLESEDDCHTLTALAREHLVRDSPFFLGPYYDSLKDRPVALDFLKVLKSNRPANWGSYEAEDGGGGDDWHEAMLTDDFAREFTAAMDSRGLALGQALAAACGEIVADRKKILDVGGGSGIYAATMVAAHAHLKGIILEQHPVDRIARRAVESHGLGDRLHVHTADMFDDAWPESADVILLSNVLHDWDLPEVRFLLGKSRAALPDGGLLIIHEAFLNAEKTGPLPVAEYSALLMHATQGKCYAVSEYEDLLREADFKPGTYRDTLGDRGFITAIK